ncbi:uncharacterized protein [Penaeus vannamei]|uniref:uncharacterized protein n=1 Tax=Penaeus vannamei TaxID=6689 RepID=UPI00387F7D47
MNLDAGSTVILLPDPPISEHPPSLTEVRGAVSKLRSGKAAELFKAGGEPMARGLHAVLAAIWHIPGKVLAHILLRHIRDHLLRHQIPEQPGFTPGESTIDHILRVIVERGLLAAYIDLEKTFNTVHWESLWEILRLRGIPTRII